MEFPDESIHREVTQRRNEHGDQELHRRVPVRTWKSTLCARMATKENRKVARGRARTPKETSVTSAASEDSYRKTVGANTQEEKKEKAKVKGKGKQKGKSKDKDKLVTEMSQEDSQSSNNR